MRGRRLSAQLEDSRFVLLTESDDVVVMAPEKVRDVVGGAVAESMKVFALADGQAPMRSRQVPDVGIPRRAGSLDLSQDDTRIVGCKRLSGSSSPRRSSRARRWPIIHDEGDPAPFGSRRLHGVLTVSRLKKYSN